VTTDRPRTADEPLTAERREVADRPAETTPAREGELVGTRSDGDGDVGEHRSRRFFRRG
jgi:hypothetical protein